MSPNSKTVEKRVILTHAQLDDVILRETIIDVLLGAVETVGSLPLANNNYTGGVSMSNSFNVALLYWGNDGLN